MLKTLGNFIEKKPWIIITVILLVTVGFSTFLPQIEMKTEFEDFMPNEEVVKANDRISSYFGRTVQTMFLFVEKEKAESTLSPEAIKELYQIESKLKKMDEVNNTFSITTFIDQICLIEFGKKIDSCTNEEVETVLNDIISGDIERKVSFFGKNDPNEEVDYSLFPKLFKGKSVDSIDVKNGYIEYDDETITFAIEVYDLSKFESDLKPPLLSTNVFEWYVDFENTLPIFESLDIDYRIAAHVEPKNPLWVVGNGFLNNINSIFQGVKNRELFNTYEKSTYLWLKPPGQEMYYPLPMKTGTVSIDKKSNQIKMQISRDELGQYGIATNLGSFQIPAKIGNFQIGSRYYKNPIGLPWQRISANTSYIFDKVQQDSIIGNIAKNILNRISEESISFDEFDEFFDSSSQGIPISDRVALKDIESSWINADNTENQIDEMDLFIRPAFFDDLETATEGFVSEDYAEDKKPSYSFAILEIFSIKDYDRIVQVNEKIVNEIKNLDRKEDYISLEATGDGVISTEINEITSEANQFIGPSIFIIIFFILILNFRKISYVILPMVALLISTIWLFGTLVILGMDFSVMQVALVPLIMGLGVDYSVHIFHNYRVELNKGKKPAEAIKISVREIGSAMFLAMITTVIAFMSFLSATVPAIKDFGILLGLGVLYTFITAITILPAIRFVLDKKKSNLKPKKLEIFDVSFIMGKVANFVLNHNKKILALMIILSLFFAFSAIRLETGFDMDQFAPDDTPSIELFSEIAEKFPSSTLSQEYILIEGDVASVEVLEGLLKTHKNFKDDSYIAKNPNGALKTTSIYTIIQDSIDKNKSLISNFNIDETNGIPKTDKDVKNLFDYLYDKESISFEEFDMESFDMADLQNLQNQEIEMDDTSAQVENVLHRNDEEKYDSTVVRVYITASAANNDQKIEDVLEILNKELQNDLSDYGENVEATITGENSITLRITSSLTESQILSTGISIILAIIVLVIAYRNPLVGLAAMVPVGVTMVWVLGTMQIIGYSLNALTITITSITIGIGIDYSIHATERFRLVADRTGDIEKAMCETISHTGGALLIAALTTACGFGILAFAPIPPQQQFGVILSITIAYSLITAILILPSILVSWAKWRRKTKGFIVTTNGLKKVNGKWVRKDSEKKYDDEYCQK